MSNFEKMADEFTILAHKELDSERHISTFLCVDSIKPMGYPLRPANGPQEYTFRFSGNTPIIEPKH